MYVAVLELGSKIHTNLQNTPFIKLLSKFCKISKYIGIEFHLIKEYVVCLVCFRHQNYLMQEAVSSAMSYRSLLNSIYKMLLWTVTVSLSWSCGNFPAMDYAALNSIHKWHCRVSSHKIVFNPLKSKTFLLNYNQDFFSIKCIIKEKAESFKICL